MIVMLPDSFENSLHRIAVWPTLPAVIPFGDMAAYCCHKSSLESSAGNKQTGQQAGNEGNA